MKDRVYRVPTYTISMPRRRLPGRSVSPSHRRLGTRRSRSSRWTAAPAWHSTWRGWSERVPAIRRA